MCTSRSAQSVIKYAAASQSIEVPETVASGSTDVSSFTRILLRLLSMKEDTD